MTERYNGWEIFMAKDIFKTVRELLDSRGCVLTGNAVDADGQLYDDSVENLNALRMLEPSLRELVDLCVNGGIEWQCLDEVIQIIGWEAA
jgi:hypothetical protein